MHPTESLVKQLVNRYGTWDVTDVVESTRLYQAPRRQVKRGELVLVADVADTFFLRRNRRQGTTITRRTITVTFPSALVADYPSHT
mgnify:FL=1